MNNGNGNGKRGVWIDYDRGPDGVWRARLRLNATSTGNTGITVSGEGRSAHEAIDRAATVARYLAGAFPSEQMMGWGFGDLVHSVANVAQHAVDIAQHPILQKIVSNPWVQSFLPPGVQPALKVLDTLTKASKSGLLGKLWSKFEDPSLRKLAKGLHEAATKGTSLSGGPICLVSGDASAGAFPFHWPRLPPAPVAHAPVGLPFFNAFHNLFSHSAPAASSAPLPVEPERK
jgi:hypothetical protein